MLVYELGVSMREIIDYLNNMPLFEKTVFCWFVLMCVIALTAFRYHSKTPSDIDICFIAFAITGLIVTVGCVIGYLSACLMGG